MEGLQDALLQALEMCVEQGFVKPLLMVGVAVDGSLFALRTDGENVQILAQHDEGEVWIAPVNMMIVDARGEAARILLDAQSGEPRLVHEAPKVLRWTQF